MQHQQCGRSGLRLSKISLGTWYNFGAPQQLRNATHGLPQDQHEANARALVRTAFEAGITHFDTADVYGSEPLLGKLLAEFPREELVIGSKAGYGAPRSRGGGSRAHLIERCERSLRTLGLDYLDLFSHHCDDRETPLEETLQTLDLLVRSGKTRYVGVSSFGYDPERTEAVVRLCRAHGWIQPIYHQTGYSLLDRLPEERLFSVCSEHGIGFCAMTALAHGRLTDKYLQGVPSESRRAKSDQPPLPESVRAKVAQLAELARERGQTTAQCALAFALAEPHVGSVLVGASRPEMLRENLAALENTHFTTEERTRLDTIFPAAQIDPHFRD